MPHLFELIGADKNPDNLPRNAGVVEIGWSEVEKDSLPHIIEYTDKRIVLPYIPHAKYFPLKEDGKYFTYHVDGIEPYYFCGDNNGHAFVIALRKNVFEKKHSYKETFCENLKPSVIKIAENAFETEAIMYEELLIVQIPLSLADIEKTSRLHNNIGYTATIVSSDRDVEVISNSYSLIGRTIYEIVLFGGYTAQICEGTIVTSRRESSENSLRLKGVNIVAKMNHLCDMQPLPSDSE